MLVQPDCDEDFREDRSRRHGIALTSSPATVGLCSHDVGFDGRLRGKTATVSKG
jgi:hypothetical protein